MESKQTKREMIEQLQLEMIIAKENNDPELYHILELIKQRLTNGDEEEEEN